MAYRHLKQDANPVSLSFSSDGGIVRLFCGECQSYANEIQSSRRKPRGMTVLEWLFGSKKKNAEPAVKPTDDEKRVRLTDKQITCLCCASLDKPIYGENPSHLNGQMPDGASCFPLRTIESLSKRGYLVSDGKGGFLITHEGMDGLRSGMGF